MNISQAYNILFLDLETSFQLDEKRRKDPSPYIAENYLISAGWVFNNDAEGYIEYKFFKHDEINDIEKTDDNQGDLQKALDKADLLVAHNAKFELGWLRACGFKYDGPIYCTQIGEYVLARGQKISLKLRDLCERYDLTRKRTDLTEEYLSKGIGFEAMPWEVVEEYGIGDIISLRDLYYHQQDILAKAEHLKPTINLMLEFCRVLIEIEENGIQIDVEELNRLENEYKATLEVLDRDLTRIAEEVMGATPINLDSPEQLSQLIYSRKVIDKKVWANVFNLGTELRGAVSKSKRKTRYTTTDFVNLVKNHTEVLYRTTAEHCVDCNGTGKLFRTKKDGNQFSKQSICKNCSGRGFLLHDTKTIAGLRFVPSSYEDTAVGGFSTDKETLQRLTTTATGIGKDFLEKVLEKNKIEVYLNTFIEGIRRGLRGNNILHPSFMQTVTATGRLSSRNPNFQNQPRGGTFPIRKVVVSRFGKDGCIVECDARQLEFRIAGELSGSKQIFDDVISNIDVHSATSTHTGYNRQDSKPHTFAPVYGATPNGKPDNIARYYRYFNDRYKLPEWHSQMATEIINSGGYYRLPSGKEFYYGEIKRYPNGGFTHSTQIANYPVQFMATGELVPIVIIDLMKRMKDAGLRSMVVLTVHDSLTVDALLYELDAVVELAKQAFENIYNEYLRRFNYELKMPIDWEIKTGSNWLELKEI